MTLSLLRRQWSLRETSIFRGVTDLLRRHWPPEKISGLLKTERIGSTADDYGLLDLDPPLKDQIGNPWADGLPGSFQWAPTSGRVVACFRRTYLNFTHI